MKQKLADDRGKANISIVSFQQLNVEQSYCVTDLSSSIVYQGIANNIPNEEIEKIHAFAQKREPDLTILIDVP